MNDTQLQVLLDKQAIYELAANYMRALDRLDGALLSAQFFDDAYCEYGFYNGAAAGFAAFAITALQSHAANHHMIGNVLIDVEGDEAFGEVYFHAYHKLASGDGFDDVVIAGRYIDRYEKRAGIWKIAYRSERNDWSRTQQTRDDYFDQAPEGLRGARLDDAIYDRSQRYKKP
jgi:hypothetical protein